MVKSRRSRRPTRLARRGLVRRLGRQLVRACLRPARRPGPDDLSQALTAFNRAMRCHRRLTRLAPRFFDSTTVDRAARHRAEQERWMAIWKPALDKVYGHDPTEDTASDPVMELPPLPGARTQRVVERELAGWDFWMAAGRAAMDRHHQRRPHALLTLTQIARLLGVAFDFKQLACGSAADDPPSESPDYSRVWADLERSYGHKSRSPSSPPPSSVPPDPLSATLDPQPSTFNQPVRPAAPAGLPPDEKRDLTPYAMVIGPHGLPCLQQINTSPP